MKKLENYACGNWIPGQGDGQLLYDAVTSEVIASASSNGLDFASMLEYGRLVGNPALRKMTFHERGRILRAMAIYLKERIEKYYLLSYRSGATRADSWID